MKRKIIKKVSDIRWIVHDKIDILKDKTKEKTKDVLQFISNNKTHLVCLGFVILGAYKSYNEHQEFKISNAHYMESQLWVTDISTDMHYKLRRPMTNREKLEFDSKVRLGAQSVGQILASMGLLE